MVRDGKDSNIYKMNTKYNKRIVNKKKILVILFIIALFLIIFVISNISKTIKSYNVYKSYKEEYASLKEVEDKKQEEIEKKRQEKLPKLTDEGKNNLENIYNSSEKRAFLTFDDGPSSVTPRILDILKQENIKATFFVLGSNVKKNPELVKRMYDEGHFIANHGYSHVYSSIYSSPQAVLDEYNNCNAEVQKALRRI